MIFKEHLDKFFLRFDHGEDFTAVLTGFLRKQNIKSAIVLGGVGMLSDFEVGWFNLETKEYENRIMVAPHELVSISGNVSERDGEPFAHLHVALASQTHALLGGHLFGGKVCNTVELFLESSPQFALKRGEGTTFRPII